MSALAAALGDMLASPLMQRAYIVAVLVGLSAPVVGTYLVQRGLALLGDGIGHIALTGVALGWIAGAAANVTPHDAWAIPGAIVASVLGAVLIEVIRARGRTRGDVALAILFYGGIAGGVILIKLAGGTTTNLTSYLFGSIATVSASDTRFTVVLAVIVLAVGIGLRGPLFALCHDEEFARSIGLPTGVLNVTVAVVAALTVSVSMRVVGALLVSAVMIVPVAIAQLVSYSFGRTMHLAMAIGVAACVIGLTITYFLAASPGAMIVVLLVCTYAVVALVSGLVRTVRARRGRRPEAGDMRGSIAQRNRSEQEVPA
ncbi:MULTISPECIES: metal ABC transporter permease [unclassified Actinomyces]|uniref:metal ABC transporter permease n=1 Tax=unclassified Actinomyces TaxID=2609248 RepID=UPI000D59B945|nr:MULTISPECIES: metal ABC transporter permease [unclassified Actinomyces]RAX21660.1 metal ABC transporter permease [Actinomyces sp. Z5]RAX21828.1 metal ABC transporter permease [Actinomyces sp. Z3]